ncbi:SusD/RagB family nutrient-binding outer membrane lipoprotein [Flavobacterium sp. WC2421]|uniref:SusD/RagB family nutrient-binding outer membrane lipoprotein n=1 Tax=Flavobacterium sp. WC2409 TaxID=3234139 RepID=A0AB39W7P7_9FLAO
MTKYIKILFVVVSGLLISCDSDFEQINTDPTKAGSEIFDPNLLLPRALYDYGQRTVGYEGPILFQSMWAQLLASPSTGGANYYDGGDKYVTTSGTSDYDQRIWNGVYTAASTANQMSILATQKNMPNLAAIGKIVKIMAISYISDVYGDVPYSEALMLDQGVSQPKYDKQQDLYPQMLADLDAAIMTLDVSKDKPTSDIYYSGDVAKWRSFGYSLMLKMAMRLTAVDAATAKTYAEKAAAGGVFASVADEAISPTDDADGFDNGNGASFTVSADVYEVRWSKTLIDYLKSNNDLRLPVVAEVPAAGLTANYLYTGGNTSTTAQIGFPNGYDTKGGSRDVSLEPNYPGASGSGSDAAAIGNYSRPTPMYRNRTTPVFILTYAQVQLLMAEAAVRGYSVSGTASQYFNNGLVGAMVTLNKFGGTQITNADAVFYAAAHPLNITSTAASLKMINEQIWATAGLTGNWVEAWNNWKRSDFPVLTPVNYPGNFSSGQIPRRQIYPSTEGSNNTASYTQAVSNMGGDTWITKMWWDK